ncbi:DUF1127 domain-containing protein [Marinobacterium lutimaris]|uniref:Uncharacterized conserved protein YjiS, DUF1127 family n=1 Tax=Marinobacterium lutimaris TaxID=568106 RepID=A0A1H6AWN8_9GAMM|nr:DUF1127 domain-containing protein [Marinobacterium lutimaris]SEG52812.1 Uncharacterized conserved protein YjiS, DUF1127 family [Marinobacterium lutimaris]
MKIIETAQKAWRELTYRYRLHQTRRKLLTLDEHQLKDLNISRVDALREGKKPFWQL